MPISCEVSRKKTKTRTQIICESLGNVIDQARKEVDKFAELKKSLDYEPGLFRQAVEKGLAKKEDIQTVLTEQKLWKNEVKAEVRSDVMAEKRRLKSERRSKRQNNKQPSLKRKAPQKRRRSPGKLI